MKLILSPLALFVLLVGTAFVWALCGDTAYYNSFTRTPNTVTQYQFYVFRANFMVHWTNGYSRSVHVETNGRYTGSIPPQTCDPDLNYGWDINTSSRGEWSVEILEESATVTGCYRTGTSKWAYARHYCSDGGDCGPLRSGQLTTPDDSIKVDDPIVQERCSSCNPDPWELSECFNGGFQYDWESCFCGASPIVIDVLGDGYNLTNAANGVVFDLNGDGLQEQISWSSAGSDEAWLALDRNGNNLIDDGKELFGDSTSQPVPPQGEKKQGFWALAEFDKSANGGNGDGFITTSDVVFDSLRLWQDSNHNGSSEASELSTLSQLGLVKLDLNYHESRRTDEHGNRFKYRAKVRDAQGAQLGRWAWDVFLLKQP